MEKNINHFKEQINNFVNMALDGHYPLFFKEWFLENNEIKNLNFNRAQKNLKEIYPKIARHHSVDRKKIALLSMANEERTLFVKSFLKVVEHKTLAGVKSLH